VSPRTLNLLLGALALLLAAASLLWAPSELREVNARAPEVARAILVELRVPRTLLGLAIGAVLGLTGAALQGLLRNPLAAPDVLGSSTGAAFGAVLASYYLGVGGTLGLALGGMAGAVGALLLLLLLAGPAATTASLVLAGVAISALASALTNLALSLAPSPFALYDVLFWLLGSLADRSLDHVLFALPPMLLGAALVLGTRRGIDALALGEDVATSLGQDVRAMRLRIVVGTGLAVGAAVAVAGAIGFIGLVVPHLVRPFVGHRPGAAMVPSALGGACLLTAADLFVRVPIAGQELKLGVVTAMLGCPFFLWLIVRGRGRATS
jgi:iron complex transport system permease protein